jgi:hypothetical protein
MLMPFRKALVATLVAAALAGCGGKNSTAARTPVEVLDDALVPVAIAAELRKQGGGHVHATATFHVDVAGTDATGGKPASPPTVTTTTDLWLDKQGNFRLLEVNDQDGGREIVRVGPDIAVALRYGKMIRRAAQDAESLRYLNEALGAPWAAWEIVRRQVEVEDRSGGYRLRLGKKRVELPAGFPAAEGLRKWRDSITVKSLDGQATAQSGGKVVLAFACKAAYQAVRDGVAVEGSVDVTMSVDQLGKKVAVVLPAAETLQTRQRTVLEEKALLGGIGSSTWPAGKKGSP